MNSEKMMPDTDVSIVRNEFSNSVLRTLTRPDLLPAEPLWRRAPTHDESGNTLSDFMMLIPKLSKCPPEKISQTLQHLQEVLNRYKNTVVFVDLNLRLNILWVSVKPVPGICLELPTAIKSSVPEALLIAQGPNQQ